jgi:hypothetical protein
MKTFLRNTLPGFWLVAALPLSLLAFGLFSLITGAELNIENQPGPIIIIMLLAHGLAGYLWANALSKKVDLELSRYQSIIVGAVFAAIMLWAAGEIDHSEQILDRLRIQYSWPVHILFGVTFMLGTGAVTGGTGAAIGAVRKDWRLALKLLGVGFLTGAGIFLVVAFLMDLVFGYRVGAPGAEQRGTMLIVMALGIWAAALVGTGVFSKILFGIPKPVRT